MDHEMRAVILDLSASILLGHATEEKIAKVGKLAKDRGEFEFFKQEIKYCDRIIRTPLT